MEQGDNEPNNRTNSSGSRPAQHASTSRLESQQSGMGSLRRPEEPMIPTGPGYLGSRLELRALGGENGLIGPNLEVQDVDGRRRTINEEDYHSKRRLPVVRSETGESEGASSIISVLDYGLAAADESLPSPLGPTEKPIPDQIKDASELQAHLGLKLIEGHSVAEVLSTKIEQEVCRSMMDENPAGKQPEYLPIDQLYNIFDIDGISSLVKELFPNATDKELRQKVADITGGEGAPRARGRRRILAILLWADYLDGLQRFIDNNIRDEDLPLERCDSRSTDCITRTRPHVTNSTLFKGWSRNQLTLFYEYQPIFHVPFFDIGEDKLCSYEFPPKARLPWCSFEYVTSGGSGTVYRIQIKPSHHNYGTYLKNPKESQKPVFFALKQINSLENEAYKKEITAHEKACARLQKGQHIIKLLLTLEHSGFHYLLFEWADGALDEFWGKRTMKKSLEAEKWAARQCFGLASALKQIHGQATWQRLNRSNGALSPGADANALDNPEYGRHGDIKPQNILWFSSYGKKGFKDHMVISDLGLTRYHTSLTRSRVTWSKIDGYSKAYRAPEMDLDNPVISSKFDIWSLGCVFLELCIWCLEGTDGIARFSREREGEEVTKVEGVNDSKFFSIKRAEDGAKVAEIKNTVTNATLMKWLDRLTDQYTEHVFAKHILDIIRKKMLVVEVSKREKIDKICTGLLSIIEVLGDDLNADNSPLPSPTLPTTTALTDPIQNRHERKITDISQVATSELPSGVYDEIEPGVADYDDGPFTTFPTTQASSRDHNRPSHHDEVSSHLIVETMTNGGSETEGELAQNVQTKVDRWMEHVGEAPTTPHSRTTSHRSPSMLEEQVDMETLPQDSISVQSRIPPSLSVNEPETLSILPAAAVDIEPVVQLQPQLETNPALVKDDPPLPEVTDIGPPIDIPALGGVGEGDLAANGERTENLNDAVRTPGGKLKSAYRRFKGALKNVKLRPRSRWRRTRETEQGA